MAMRRAVCDATAVPPGTMHRVSVEGTPILLVNLEGVIHAVQAVCTHEGYGLEAGELDGHVLTCSLHYSSFDVRTGEVLDPPADLPLAAFRAFIEGGRIVLEIPDGPIQVNE